MIFLSGADNITRLRTLIACNADRVAVNIGGLARQTIKNWTLDLPVDDWEWIAYTDGAVTLDQVKFALDHAAKAPLYIVGGDTLKDIESYVPLWNGDGNLPIERELGLCVTDRVFKDTKLARRALSTRLQGGAMGVLTGSIDPDINKYDFVISSAWWAVLKYGETQIWDGRDMHRFNSDRQIEVRTQYRESIEALGLDADLVIAGDNEESAKMAIESWKSYARSFNSSRPATVLPLPSLDTPAKNDSPKTGTRSQSLDMTPPQERHEHQLLPVLSLTTITSESYDGPEGKPHVRHVLSSSPNTVRRCNNCTLAQAGCPGYLEGSLCAYKIPIEIRSKDQLAGVMTAILETQTQRVLQARFFEEVTGQELGPDFGLEADRLFRLIEKMGGILDNRETLKMTVEAKSNGGMISRLFGDKAGQNARALVNPLDPNRVIDTITSDD